MGMYDDIIIGCPDCGGDCSTQSKAGPCKLAAYTLAAVQPAIADAIEGKEVWCRGCSKQWVIMRIGEPVTIRMALRPWEPDDAE